MSTPGEDAFEVLKNDPKYEKKYLNSFQMQEDARNPFLKVIPLEFDDFFPTKVCHILCITGPFSGWDNDSVSECMGRLEEVYEDFAKYEVHIMIDEEAEDVQSAGEDKMQETEDAFTQFIEEYNAEELGFTYHGKLNATAIQDKIAAVIVAFYS